MLKPFAVILPAVLTFAAHGTPMVDVRLTEVITLRLEVGYQGINFKAESSFGEDFFNSFLKFELAQRPNDIFNPGIGFTKPSEIGFGSNFYDHYHAERILMQQTQNGLPR